MTSIQTWVDLELAALQSALGVPPGPLTRAFFELAERSGGVDAFEGLQLILCNTTPIPGVTPLNLVPFGSTGLSAGHFGFFKGTAASTDELAIGVMSPLTVVLRDLSVFLSLAAFAGAGEIDADAQDEQLARTRHERWAEDGEFTKLSELLCTLPGVSVPASPRALLTLKSPVKPKFPRRTPDMITLDAAQQLVDRKDVVGAAEVLGLLVDKFIDLGDLVSATNWSHLDALLAVVRVPLTSKKREALAARGLTPPA